MTLPLDSPFDQTPRVKSRRLNVLPENPEQANPSAAVGTGRFPSWLHRKMPSGTNLLKTHDVLDKLHLPTVCEEAKCPNLLECYSQKTATFLAMGKQCTRNCGFCDIDFAAKPSPLEEDEPLRLAHSVKQLGLKHVVITMVARDDLEDGGALHLVQIIETIREQNEGITIEILTSDFQGNFKALDLVLSCRPEIFNHNVETVRELTPRVRHKATYERTLEVLKHAKSSGHVVFVKSGIMVGLGETESQIHETLHDLKEAGCDIVTIGHYLQPNRHKLRVKSFISPTMFSSYAEYGHQIGIKHVYAGPFVRSSYNAASLFQTIKNRSST